MFATEWSSLMRVRGQRFCAVVRRQKEPRNCGRQPHPDECADARNIQATLRFLVDYIAPDAIRRNNLGASDRVRNI